MLTLDSVIDELTTGRATRREAARQVRLRQHAYAALARTILDDEPGTVTSITGTTGPAVRFGREAA